MADETMVEPMTDERLDEIAGFARGVARVAPVDMAGWQRGAVVNAYVRHTLELVTEVKRLRAAQANEPRAIIRHFAAAMERKLAANDVTKGGWRDGSGWNPQTGLRQKLQEEVGELSDALEAFLWRGGSEEDVLLEAADVALVAMMLADVVGALPPTDERGR